MLKQHNQLMLVLLVLADACAIGCAWLASYWIRFNYLPVDPTKGVPALSDKFLPLLPAVVVVHLLIFARVRLYRPRRANTILNETGDIIKAFCVAVVAVILIDYALPAANKISRQFVATYAVIGTAFFALFRASVRLFLHVIRRRGFNRRSAAIIGAGRSAQRLLHALRRNAWTGFDVQYFVDDRQREYTGELRGLPIYGPLEDLRQIIETRPVDAVFIALPAPLAHRTDEVLIALRTSLADVRIVPEINPYHAMRPTFNKLDGIPILSIRQTPLYGWNAVSKRAFDLIVGAFCLSAAALPMLLIALLIKLTSRGPVFYKQRRMGFDGHQFDMYKFRTMVANAESEGPVWSQREDPRRTRVGAFLRRTSLDELPNLFNVFKGDMSLVGPRPERPEFIEQFKDEIPRYMLRHKMKAGMTGIAQIRGYRGDSSLRKRIQHDVHYINNWSLGLDVRILFETVYGAWFSRHES